MSLLLSSSVQVSVVVLVALVGTTLLRGRAAAVRHWLLTVAVVCGALMPSLGLVVPRWQLPPLSRRTQPAQTSDVITAVALRVNPPIAAVGATAPSAISGRVDRLAALGPWLVALWLAGGAACLCMWLAGCIRLAAIVSRSRPITDRAWTDGAAEIARAYGLGRPIALLETDRPALLVTWGIRRPTIIVPAAARDWPPDRIRIVLSHELGHIRRGDWIVQIVADLLRAAYWFNPLLWMASRRLRQESEHACDDAVMSLGVDRTEYATHLVDIARTFNAERRAWLPGIPAPAIARSSTLERRISAMLNRRLNHNPLTGSARFAVAAVPVCLTVLLAGLRAQTFGAVTGLITDQSGGLLPNATVMLADEHTKTKHEVRTDATGRFQFVGLTQADYAFDVRLAGFANLHDTVPVTPGQTIQKDVTLHVGSLEETITVVDSDGPQVPIRSGVPEYPPPPPPPPSRVAAALTCAPSPIGGNIKPPRKIRDVRPVYPENLRAAKWDGGVILDALIGTDGFVKEARVTAPVDPDIERAALTAVMQWQFTPTLLNCNAVEVTMKVNVSFKPRP